MNRTLADWKGIVVRLEAMERLALDPRIKMERIRAREYAERKIRLIERSVLCGKLC